MKIDNKNHLPFSGSNDETEAPSSLSCALLFMFLLEVLETFTPLSSS